MSDAFLSSDDFDEQAHQLYNEGRYDEALLILKEGITLYPHAVELHIGMAYAHLAREEYAWARRSFEQRPGARSRPRGRPGRPGRNPAQAGRPGRRHAGLRAHPPARLPGRSRADAAGGPRAVPRRAHRAGAPVLRSRRVGPSRLARRGRLPGLRLAPAGQRRRARSTGSAARSSSTRPTPRRGSISPTCSTTGARPRRRCTSSSAPSPTTTSTSSASGGTSSSRRPSTACPTRIPSWPPGSPGWARWPASPTRSTCCSPRSRRSRPTAACAIRTSSSCSARC